LRDTLDKLLYRIPPGWHNDPRETAVSIVRTSTTTIKIDTGNRHMRAAIVYAPKRSERADGVDVKGNTVVSKVLIIQGHLRGEKRIGWQTMRVIKCWLITSFQNALLTAGHRAAKKTHTICRAVYMSRVHKNSRL
jgi:hypothetical protein